MFRELLGCLGAVDEPRQAGKADHVLVDVLAITVCAVLAHAESFEDIELYGRHKEQWLRRFLDLENGIPSHDTFRRVFMMISAEQFEACFLAWTRTVFAPADEARPRQIAVDGKTMRRSFERRKARSPLHVVSAFATQEGITLALISLDALYARKAIAKEITSKSADYLIALKKNNKKDHEHVVHFFAEAVFNKKPSMKAVFDAFDETHGRLVRRHAFVSDDADLLEQLAGWSGVTKVIAVETITSVNHVHGGGRGETTFDIRYFLTSAALDGQVLATAVRDHWAIENSLHWVLDMGFREDECRVRHKNAAANLSVIRKIAINLVKADSARKGSIKGKRKAAVTAHLVGRKATVGVRNLRTVLPASCLRAINSDHAQSVIASFS